MARPRFEGAFQSIALACHGPPVKEAVEGEFEWKISEKIVIHDDKEIKDPTNAVRALMMALADAVDNQNDRDDDDGRVDLFACSLLASVEGKEVFIE